MDEHIRTLYEIVGKLVTQGGKHLEFQAVMVEQVAKLVEGQKELVEGQKELASGQKELAATQTKLLEDVQWLIDSHAQIVDRLDILEQGQRDLFRLYDTRGASDCLSREATPRAKRYLRRAS